jgi:diguanylate cyclase
VGLGFPYQPVSSQRTIVLSVPFLFVYGIGLSILSWQLARRVKSQNRQLKRLSRMDPLVELANRGFLILRAQQALDKAQGQGGFACLLMLDVDDFKRINDSHGHRAGDEVLRHIASTLRAFARPGDTLRGWEATSSSCCCRTVRPSMRCMWQSGFGCNFWRQHGRQPGHRVQRQHRIAATPRGGSVEDWLALADRALYHAKRRARTTPAMANEVLPGLWRRPAAGRPLPEACSAPPTAA